MRFGYFCPLILVVGTAGAQLLRIQPIEITAGETATLTWNTSYPAFLMGFGRIAGRGSAALSPSSSMDFVMIEKTPAGIRYTTRRLLVNGAKGEDGYPAIQDFGVASQGHLSGIDYIGFQSFVWETLQKNGYSVKGDYVPGRPFVIFYTNYELRPDLVSKDEKIRARRIALAVEIYEPAKDGTVLFGVRPSLQFQYRGEDDWRMEREGFRARTEASKFLTTLEKER